MDTSDVVNRLTFHRTRQVPFLNYLDKTDPKLACKLSGCGSWLHIREWELSGKSTIKNANFCKEFLICPSCAARRAAKLVTAYANRVEVVQDMHPGLKAVMITLTVKNGPDLAERLQHIKDSWRRMMAAKRQGATVKSRNATIEWNKVLGSIRAIEIKLGKNSGLWHPHIHVYALVNEDVSKFHLSAEWERFTGDSKIVHVQECYNGTVAGLIEVLKYVTKPCELPFDLMHHMHTVAKGSRFTDPQGLMRGVPEPCIDSDDDSEMTGPYRDFIMLWSGSSYRMESVGHRLEILKPGDPGYGAPRELVYHNPGDAEYDSGVAFPPDHVPPPRAYYPNGSGWLDVTGL